MINWDKPLECEYGDISLLSKNDKFACVGFFFEGYVEWTIWLDGTPVFEWMPCVYNKKPEPEVGEVWMCKLGDYEFPVRKMGVGWSAYSVELTEDITPLYKMERVEG